MRFLLARLLRSLRLLRFDLLARSVERHPSDDEIAPGEILVVESEGVRKWACLKCPGGCGIKIALSLNPNRRPRWGIVRDWFGRPTVTPSVHQKNECGCHFWIREGRVDWCPGNQPRR
ncbi:MAG: hypothetical protein J0H67_07350 [Rhodospirillales bacterium]|nr:hypothetical protein [Rhodospirillales bacterium]